MECSRMASLRSQHLSNNSKIGNKPYSYLGEECSEQRAKVLRLSMLGVFAKQEAMCLEQIEGERKRE